MDIISHRRAMAAAFLNLALAFVSGCGEDPVARAEEDYRVLEKTSGDNAEMCAAARAVQRAAVRTGKKDDAVFWGLIADQRCLLVKIEGPHA